MSAVFWLSLRALGRRRRLTILALLLAIPSVVALIFFLSKTVGDGTHFAVELFDNFMLPVLIPAVALIVASSALGHEIEDRTLIYLTLRPIRKATILAAKYLASLLIVGMLTEAAVLSMFLIASRKTQPYGIVLVSQPYDQGSTLAALLWAGAGATIAYVGLFLLFGLLMPQRGLLVGFAYVLLWEGVVAGVLTALSTLSVRRYAQGLLDSGVHDHDLATIVPSTLTGVGAVAGILIILAAALGIGVWRLTRMELP